MTQYHYFKRMAYANTPRPLRELAVDADLVVAVDEAGDALVVKSRYFAQYPSSDDQETS